MDVSKFLDPIADYVNNLVLFLVFDRAPFEKLRQLPDGEIYVTGLKVHGVSTWALSIFFTGALIAVLLNKRAALGGVHAMRNRAVPVAKAEGKVESSTLLRMFIGMLLFPPLFHLGIWVAGLWSETQWQSIYVTLNAWLILNGMIFPGAMLIDKLTTVISVLGERDWWAAPPEGLHPVNLYLALVAQIVSLIAFMTYLVFGVGMIGVAHGLSAWAPIAPILSGLIPAFIILALFGSSLLLERKITEVDAENKPQDPAMTVPSN